MRESSRSTDAPPSPALSRALGLAREALADAPAGLLTDFDGTLSPIVADPSLARLVEGASGALGSLAARLAVVAVITGRAPLDARRMTGLPGLLIAGNHGIEWLEPGADTAELSPRAGEVRADLDAVLGRLPELPGVTVEHKGISATVHYRGAADPDVARTTIVEALGDPGGKLELRHGRMSVELRPVGLGDKGAAARAVIDRHRLRGAVVMGDDLTDLDMFEAVRRLRDSGRLRGSIVGVGGTDREVPPEIAASADVLLADPEEAARFLAALAAGPG